MKILEVCTGDPSGIQAAIQGGADRIELCSGLAEGGLTPSAGIIRYAVSQPIKVNVLIRPRSGDFVYSKDEVELMLADIKEAIDAGADGIVVGALTPDGDVDEEACRKFIKAAGAADTTFHRAFDVCRNPFESLETIIGLGFKRILTSGQKASALEGADMLRQLNERAAGRIRIMAGAGVNQDNAYNILSRSMADDIHASARSTVPSGMRHSQSGASMGSADASDGSRLGTDSNIVKEIKNICINLTSNQKP